MFDDIEQLAMQWLDGRVTIPVVNRIPRPRPAEFVRVMITGATRTSVAYRRCQVTCDVWAESESRAQELASMVEQALDAWPLVSEGEMARVSGPVSAIDPDSGVPVATMTCVATQHTKEQR